MRRTKLLKYVRKKQTPSLCLMDDEYYDRKSPAEVYGIRCYDLANNYQLISYAQGDF